MHLSLYPFTGFADGRRQSSTDSCRKISNMSNIGRQPTIIEILVMMSVPILYIYVWVPALKCENLKTVNIISKHL